MRLAHDAHVMPVIASSTSLRGWASALDSVVMVASLRVPEVAGVVGASAGAPPDSTVNAAVCTWPRCWKSRNRRYVAGSGNAVAKSMPGPAGPSSGWTWR